MNQPPAALDPSDPVVGQLHRHLARETLRHLIAASVRAHVVEAHHVHVLGRLHLLEELREVVDPALVQQRDEVVLAGRAG
jgi:hypothetical protein